MEFDPYLDTLRRDLAAAAAPGGAEVARAADLLSGALDASVRLCLIEVLSDATAEITTELDGASVEVRMRGRSADLVVNRITAPEPVQPPPPVVPTDGADLARVSLRLPESLKEAVERAAAAEGISVNAWLVRAVHAATNAGGDRTTRPGGGPLPPPPPAPPGVPGRGRRVTGFAQA